MEKMAVLEEKIRKATDLIRSLREDRMIIEDQLKSARDEVKRLSLMKEENPEYRGKLEQLSSERGRIAERVERMISIIEEVEAS
ncbi:MAG: hypothetical protein ACE5HU_10290 [Acidobacteriota bacterium]